MSLLHIKMTQKLYLVLFMKFFSLFFILMMHTTQLFLSCTSVFFLKLNQSIFYLSDNECSFTTNQPYFAITVSNKYYVFSIFTIYITYMVYLYIYMVIKKKSPLSILRHLRVVNLEFLKQRFDSCLFQVSFYLYNFFLIIYNLLYQSL